jgi:hypothetical protein
MSDLSNETIKHTTKSRETIPLNLQQVFIKGVSCYYCHKAVGGNCRFSNKTADQFQHVQDAVLGLKKFNKSVKNKYVSKDYYKIIMLKYQAIAKHCNQKVFFVDFKISILRTL